MTAVWLDRWIVRHRLAMIAVSVAAVVAVASGWNPDVFAQLVMVAVGVAIIGLPHGAFDFHLAARTAPPSSRAKSLFVFCIVYCAIGSAVVITWMVAPAAALLAFLLVSALHFGFGDVSDGGTALGAAEGVARGAVVIGVPIWMHRDDCARLFAYLVPESSSFPIDPIADAAALCGTVALAGLPSILVARVARGERPANQLSGELLSAIAVAWLLAFTPPLLGFLVYFCGWHSLRQAGEIAASLHPTSAMSGFAALARATAPLVAVVAATAVLASSMVPGLTLDVGGLTRLVFVGLAALSFPHIAFHLLLAIARRTNGSFRLSCERYAFTRGIVR